MEEAQMHHDEARKIVTKLTERTEGEPGLHECIAEISAQLYSERLNGKQSSEILITSVNTRFSLTKSSKNELTKVI